MLFPSMYRKEDQMHRTIDFSDMGIHLKSVGVHITIFGFDIAFYGMIIGPGILTGLFDCCGRGRKQAESEDYFDLAILCGDIFHHRGEALLCGFLLGIIPRMIC